MGLIVELYFACIYLYISGSRSHKTWFLVPKKQLLLTMTDKPEKMIPTFTKQTCRAIKDMLNLLQHPFIYPIHNIDFMVDQNIVVVMYQICKRGSLKDFIYQVLKFVMFILSVYLTLKLNESMMEGL